VTSIWFFLSTLSQILKETKSLLRNYGMRTRLIWLTR